MNDYHDKNILRHLIKNGRLSWATLAEKVHLSASACQRRVQAMEDNGTISGFAVQINHTRLGFPIKAFVSVNIERQNLSQVDSFRDWCRDHEQILSAHMLSGDVDFLLEVVSEDLESLSRFMEEQLLSLPAVKDAASSLVLRNVKSHQ